ncbi:hypothetical protein LTR37_004522 [Vermiconidia calcicola]|uniref:Uncharacterized protein n=1 Tax=Vermiconidia calcicola TaxID=1690605 RepID=A0ACC3NMA4_9PEZI|nr:hypothetical protein LTR37_004522 [Vermiconidia calcicola]
MEVDDEDDAPPMLVAADGTSDPAEAVLNADLGSVKITKVPITIITARHGKKIAVILNEFGNTTDIEKSLTVNQDNEAVSEWLDLANGCICCSVKDSGVNAIESLMERRGAFDYILLETTGLADPGNIAPLFWVDEGLGSTIYLDGVVTLVDAKNVLKSLDEPVGEERIENEHEHEHEHGELLMSTAHLQISHADVVVLNKADLVTSEEMRRVESRVRSINSLATIQTTDHSQVPQLEGLILDLHAYDDVTTESLDFASKGHSHLDPAIGTVTVHLPSLNESQLDKLDEWLRSVLWESELPREELPSTWEIHRTKGRLGLSNGMLKMLQGVREIFEMIDAVDACSQSPEGGAAGKIVFIGKNIGTERVTAAFQQSLDACLAIEAR